jgi:hypothetical protein
MADLIERPSANDQGGGSGPRLADRLAARLHLSRYSFYLVILLAVFVILHLIKSCFMGLQVDEANWLMQTKYLSAGYFYHPPFIAYELFAITKVFGDGLLAIRLGSIFFTTGSLLLIYLLFRAMFHDERWAFWTTLVLAILPITNFWLMLAIQDSPFLFFTLLTTWLLWRIASEDKRNYCYLAGITSGLMLLCKLQAWLFFLGIFLFVLASRENRRWLRRKETYLAILIVILMFLPTFIWYIGRNFEPITYQLRNRPGFLNYGFFGYVVLVIEHIAKEMLVLSPFVYLFSIFGLIYGGYLGYSAKGERDRRFQFLFCLSAPVIIFFTITGGPPYWAIPGHFICLVAAAGALPVWFSRTSHARLQRFWRPVFWGTCVIVPLLMTAGAMTITIADHVRNEYKPLAEKIEGVREGMGSDEVYLAGAYYHIPSEIAYYEDGKFQGYTILFQVYEHPVIRAGDNTYTPWTSSQDLVGKDIIFVDAENNLDDYSTPASYWEEKLAPYFERVEGPIIFSYNNLFGSERIFYIFKCYGFKGPDPQMDTKGDIHTYINQ